MISVILSDSVAVVAGLKVRRFKELLRVKLRKERIGKKKRGGRKIYIPLGWVRPELLSWWKESEPWSEGGFVQGRS